MRKTPIYISLTTIKSRIKNVAKTIDSIANQTLPPDKIFLFISREPYLLDGGIREEDIPLDLAELRNFGVVEIRYTRNTGPYRKLIPLLQENIKNDCIIITSDDDTIYPQDWIEKFIQESEKYPDSIISFRNRYVSFVRGVMQPYNSWSLIDSKFYFENNYNLDSDLVFPIGMGGVLYKPSFFKEIIFDEAYLEVCPYADDIWFKLMALISGTKNRIVVSKYLDTYFRSTPTSQGNNLSDINFKGKKSHIRVNNDTQMKEAIAYLKKRYGLDVNSIIKTKKPVFKNQKHGSTPIFPRKLDGTIWGITAFFNPAGYKNKYENYEIFREKSKAQGLKLCVVELAFGDRPFEFKDGDAEILIQLRGSERNILWQKEALLNIGLNNLPPDCDKIVWLDCDVIFANNDWVKETSRLLEKYMVVQPYTLCVIMPKDKKIEEIDIDKLEFGKLNNNKRFGMAYTRHVFLDKLGHPGFAWAARREVFDVIGFYDRLAIGTADAFMSEAFYSPVLSIKQMYTHRMIEDLSSYTEALFNIVRGSVYYAGGNLFHLWHGNLKNRRYIDRMFILKNHNYYPQKDLSRNIFGLLEWSCRKEEMKRAVKKYFFVRNEDSSIFGSGKYFFLEIYYSIRFDSVLYMFALKKDYILGKTGLILKRISPALYESLVKRKPDWAKPLDA